MKNLHRPIMVVNQFWSESDEGEGRSYTGVYGNVVRGMLHRAGIDRKECAFSSVFNFRPAGNKIDSCFATTPGDRIEMFRPLRNGKYIDKKYAPEIERLLEEIKRVKPNVILALGELALWAICKKSGIKKYRGSPIMSHCNRWKVIPTWDAPTLMAQWEENVVAFSDYCKARAESSFPELVRPERLIHLDPTIPDLYEFYEKYLRNAEYISCDIETKMQTITDVGFGPPGGKVALVIPFWDRSRPDGNYWRTAREEREAWRFVQMVVENHPTMGQNFSYDMSYFFRTMKIRCNHFVGDTMLLHHSIQPELQKGLGFLASVHTNEPSWKFMRQIHASDNVKKGDE